MCFVLDGSTTEYFFNTEELAGAFGIPDGMHLVITGISLASVAADAGNVIIIDFDRIANADEQDAVPGFSTGSLSRSSLGRLYHIINAANTSFSFAGPVDVYNTLYINDGGVGGPSNSVLHFFFHFEPGSMDWSQEHVSHLGDIRQVGREVAAGSEFYQVGDRFKVQNWHA